MKVFKYPLVLAFIIFYNYSFSQNTGKAYYQKISKNSFDGFNEKNGTSVNDVINSMKFELAFNDSIASYKEISELNISKNSHSAKMATVFSGYQGPYYFNLVLRTAYRKRGKYLISKPLNSFYNWTLLNDTININGLKCYKATTVIHLQGRRGAIEREITAWYTPEININLGPDGFTGLPGLIIQLEQQNIVTRLSQINFTDNKAIINIPSDGRKMTEEEFAIYTKDLVENREKYYGKN